MLENPLHYGEHYLLDLHGCDACLIRSAETVREVLMDAAVKCKSSIISDSFHQFEPYGASGVILIAESHFSVHTWPESNFVSVDIYTSGNKMKPEIAIRLIESGFDADRIDVVKLTRGQLTK